jgi:predicted PurR-regulated permease PerM
MWKNRSKNGTLQVAMLKKIEVSHKTIIFTVLFLLGLWFLYFIKDIIFALFVALLLMTILNPVVTRLARWKIPRGLAVFITYIILVGVLVAAVVGIIPPLVEQTTNFVNNLPSLLSNPFMSKYINDQVVNQIVSQLGSVPKQIFEVGVSVFSNLVAVISVMIFTFYMLLYRGRLDDQIGSIFGGSGREKFDRILGSIEKSLGNWARGQIILMLVQGALVYVGLIILGIPYALPLAIFTALLEIVPTIGIIVAAIPIVAIGLSISPIMGLATAALVFLVHQLEGYILVPKIMEKSAGVNPIVTLTSLAVGFRVAGVMGALISVPVFLMLQIAIKEYLQSK